MDILRLSSKLSLGFGLTWEQHDAFGTSEHNQIAKWRADGYALAARYAHDGGRVYGLMRKPATPLAKGVLSGAGVIATHPALKGKSGLVLLEVSDKTRGQCVICVGLRNGVVVIDRLVSPDEVADVRNHYLSKHSIGSEPYETWGEGEVQTMGQVDHEFGFDELTPRRKGAKAVRITILQSARWFAVAGAATGAVLLVFLAVNWYVSDSEQSAKLRALRAQSNQTPVALYSTELNTWRARTVYPAAASVQAVRDYFASFSAYHAGWALSKVACGVSSCMVSWTRKDGTIEEFKATAPAAWQGITPVDQDGMVMTVALALPEGKHEPESWPRAEAYRDRLVSRWQLLAPGGWKATVTGPAQVGIPEGFTASQRAAVATVADAPMALAITIKDQPWWYADADPDSPVSVANLGKYVELTQPPLIELTANGREFVFSFNGVAYVQK